MMRICFVDNPHARDWGDAANRFLELEPQLTAAGYEVVFCDAAADSSTNYLAGCERESDALPLLASARMVEKLKSVDADLTIFPLRGGLAHGLLMARGCGEFSDSRRIALWCDAPTREIFLGSDVTVDTLAPLVADALERACLELADALILPRPERLDELALLGVALPPVIGASPALAATKEAYPLSETIRRLAYIGPLKRSAGAVAFIDAVEGLAARQRLGAREIVFAGPIDNPPFAVGKSWLGLRAARWTFPFRVVETNSRAKARKVTGADALAIVMTHDVEDLALRPHDLVIELGSMPTNDLGASIAQRIQERLTGGACLTPPRSDWPALIESVRALPLRNSGRAAAQARLSICTVHFERPALLEQAIDSIDAAESDDIEIIIIDNGSRSAESHAMLDRLALRKNVRIERLVEPLPYPVAYNHAASLARREFLAFLDDDNFFLPGGVERLREACARGSFDVVVSSLELFDPGSEGAPGVITFIGPARSAGLFFNAFGDTCLAVRRAAFLQIGGFRDSIAAYPTADWVMLARAQAAGLKIGVLQQPAYRYRRDPDRAATNWQKFDQHGVRGLVLQSYGAAYDPQVIAKLAQGLWLMSM